MHQSLMGVPVEIYLFFRQIPIALENCMNSRNVFIQILFINPIDFLCLYILQLPSIYFLGGKMLVTSLEKLPINEISFNKCIKITVALFSETTMQ